MWLFQCFPEDMHQRLVHHTVTSSHCRVNIGKVNKISLYMWNTWHYKVVPFPFVTTQLVPTRGVSPSSNSQFCRAFSTLRQCFWSGVARWGKDTARNGNACHQGWQCHSNVQGSFCNPLLCNVTVTLKPSKALVLLHDWCEALDSHFVSLNTFLAIVTMGKLYYELSISLWWWLHLFWVGGSTGGDVSTCLELCSWHWLASRWFVWKNERCGAASAFSRSLGILVPFYGDFGNFLDMYCVYYLSPFGLVWYEWTLNLLANLHFWQDMPFDTYILVAYSTAGWSWSFEVK